MTPDRQPTASMRLQLTPDFGFAAAAERFSTIARLGVSHVYLSPIAEAVPGSTHGYDVVDHAAVRTEFGGDDGLAALLDAAEENSLGVIVDHVPNHVSVERAELNARWWSTLRDGPSGPDARWFDVDWEAAGGKVIVPKLGSPLDELLVAGEIEAGEGDLGPELRVGTQRFPLASGTEQLDLPEMLDSQYYRLQFWRDPDRNVRRFFTIDDLVAVRVDDGDVADVVDTLPRRLAEHPAFAGIRVDHVDGLAAPGDYLDGLRQTIGDRLLLVEKIVAPGERLPPHWPVDGTTGYEQIAIAEHVMLDPAAGDALSRAWRRWAGDLSFADVEETSRREVLAEGLGPDVGRLSADVVEAGVGDATPESVRRAVEALTLAIERYRTYLPRDPASQDVFDEVVDTASGEGDAVAVRRVAETIRETPALLRRWQQLTGPAVAKGGEDRAFYRWYPLGSLCEVGGDPGRFSVPVAEFHEAQRRRQDAYPSTMLAETTHDTKRSGGVRARSLALAAHASEWERVVDEWRDTQHDLIRPIVEADSGLGAGVIDLALQTVVTTQPIDAERLGDYLVKSAREADLITSWTEPAENVESGLRDLAGRLVGDATDGRLAEIARRVESEGDAAGLGLLAMQLTVPGFADLYQGSPRRLLSLVDPDNRRPVDWDGIASLADRIETTDTVTAMADGDIDLARAVLTERMLRLRRRRPEAFGSDAGYVELDVDGPGAEHVIAYARTDGTDPCVAVVVTRALGDVGVLDEVEVVLPDGTWRSLLADDAEVRPGGSHRLADLVRRTPDRGGAPRFEVLDRTG